ncbi:MAG TPA: hypothetical protein VFO41_05805 [Alphaproteobacteria bacterium]|nr:hypothetical protein [Alphaproteobacteria bacterium]
MSVSALADSILVENVDLTVADPTTAGSDGFAEQVRLPDTWSLSLDDLMPDEGREIVLTSPENTAIELASNAPIADRGVADPHVTAAGIDVEGLRYVRFESGPTLYYEGDLTITPV